MHPLIGIYFPIILMYNSSFGGRRTYYFEPVSPKTPAKTHLSKGYIDLLKVASSSGFWQTSTCLWGVFYQVMAPLVDF